MNEAETVLTMAGLLLFVMDVLTYAHSVQTRNMVLKLDDKLAEHFGVVHPDVYEKKNK